MREVESDAKRQALSVEVKKDAKMDTLPGPAEIPSLAEWKKDSDEKVSFRKFAGRIEQVAALDRLIERYHRRPINPVTQYALLIRMQDEIYSHLTLKPQSDRRLRRDQAWCHGHHRFEEVDPDARDSATV